MKHCTHWINGKPWVGEAERQGDRADDIFGDVGWNTGRFLGPRNPEHGILRDFSAKQSEMFLQLASFFDKEMNEPGVSNRTRREVYSAWNRSQQFAIVIGRIDRNHDCSCFDSEFLRQRCS